MPTLTRWSFANAFEHTTCFCFILFSGDHDLSPAFLPFSSLVPCQNSNASSVFALAPADFLTTRVCAIRSIHPSVQTPHPRSLSLSSAHLLLHVIAASSSPTCPCPCPCRNLLPASLPCLPLSIDYSFAWWIANTSRMKSLLQ